MSMQNIHPSLAYPLLRALLAHWKWPHFRWLHHSIITVHKTKHVVRLLKWQHLSTERAWSSCFSCYCGVMVGTWEKGVLHTNLAWWEEIASSSCPKHCTLLTWRKHVRQSLIFFSRTVAWRVAMMVGRWEKVMFCNKNLNWDEEVYQVASSYIPSQLAG